MKVIPPPAWAPVLSRACPEPIGMGGSGILVFSGSLRSLSLVLRVARGSSRKSGSALGFKIVLFAELRYAAEPVGARDLSRSERPSD